MLNFRMITRFLMLTYVLATGTYFGNRLVEAHERAVMGDFAYKKASIMLEAEKLNMMKGV